MTQKPHLAEFKTASDMASALASQISKIISSAINRRGSALIAVSGGSTPECLYRTLSKHPLPWDKVTAVLVDERFVPPDHLDSNERFVRHTLAQNHASKIKIMGLWQDGLSLQDASREASRRVDKLSYPPDATILGLGLDGHTASWLPGARGLEDVISGQGASVSAIISKPSDLAGPHGERLSLSLAMISKSSKIFLVFYGRAKRAVWMEALSGSDTDDLPVRALFKCRNDIVSAWAP